MKALVLESPGAIPKAALAMLAMLAIVACTSATPTPPPQTYWPTYADFALAAHQKNSRTIDYPKYASYVAIYVAQECFAGNPLTLEGFRSFVDQTLFEYADGGTVEAVLGKELVGKMLALEGKDVRGSCIEPYMYPKTGAEASLGQALIWSEMRARVGGLAASYLLPSVSSLDGHAASWFQQDAQTRKPFVPWFWEREQLGPFPPIPSNVPVPRGGAWTPTWALEYQLGIAQARIAQSQ